MISMVKIDYKPEEAGKILVKYVPELEEKMVIASQKYLAKEYKAEAPKWGEMKKEVWTTYGKWMFDNGLLENELKASILFITHDIDEAIFLSDKIYVFSERPASIKSIFEVNINRPRDNNTFTSMEFNQMKKEILNLL